MRAPMCQPDLPFWESWGLPGAQAQDAEAIAKDPLIPAPLLLLLIHVSPNNTTKGGLEHMKSNYWGRVKGTGASVVSSVVTGEGERLR